MTLAELPAAPLPADTMPGGTIPGGDVVVACRGLTKCYPIWRSPIWQMLGLAFPRVARPARRFTAPDDVHPVARRGEMGVGSATSGHSVCHAVSLPVMPAL